MQKLPKNPENLQKLSNGCARAKYLYSKIP